MACMRKITLSISKIRKPSMLVIHDDLHGAIQFVVSRQSQSAHSVARMLHR